MYKIITYSTTSLKTDKVEKQLIFKEKQIFNNIT